MQSIDLYRLTPRPRDKNAYLQQTTVARQQYIKQLSQDQSKAFHGVVQSIDESDAWDHFVNAKTHAVWQQEAQLHQITHNGDFPVTAQGQQVLIKTLFDAILDMNDTFEKRKPVKRGVNDTEPEYQRRIRDQLEYERSIGLPVDPEGKAGWPNAVRGLFTLNGFELELMCMKMLVCGYCWKSNYEAADIVISRQKALNDAQECKLELPPGAKDYDYKAYGCFMDRFNDFVEAVRVMTNSRIVRWLRLTMPVTDPQNSCFQLPGDSTNVPGGTRP